MWWWIEYQINIVEWNSHTCQTKTLAWLWVLEPDDSERDDSEM